MRVFSSRYFWTRALQFIRNGQAAKGETNCQKADNGAHSLPVDLSVLTVSHLDEFAEAARIVVVTRFSIPERLHKEYNQIKQLVIVSSSIKYIVQRHGSRDRDQGIGPKLLPAALVVASDSFCAALTVRQARDVKLSLTGCKWFYFQPAAPVTEKKWTLVRADQGTR
jgi:hypothetical protein